MLLRAELVLLALLLSGCGLFHRIFKRQGPPEPRPPAAVERFAVEANALGLPLSPPSLAEVTRAMASAVEALPGARDPKRAAAAIREQASALERASAPSAMAHARASLDAALQEIDSINNPPGTPEERERVVTAAYAAVEQVTPEQPFALADEAYRAVAGAMVVVTGGKVDRAPGSELGKLVDQFAVQEQHEARRAGASAVAAMSAAIAALPVHSRELDQSVQQIRSQADSLAQASHIKYAARMKEALGKVADTLDALQRARPRPALSRLLVEAHRAVNTIEPTRPFDLQRAVIQNALRALADTILLAGEP